MADFVKVITVQELSRKGLRGIAPTIECLAEAEGLAGACAVDPSEVRTCLILAKQCATLPSYHPPLAGRDGLRLDFNENTVGCSPRVLERLRQLEREELARYPEREPVEAVVAEHPGDRAGGTAC